MNTDNNDYAVLFAIVNYGMGSKVIRIAKECGVYSGTIMFGMGTVNNRLLERLALADVRKEIVFVIDKEHTIADALTELNDKLEFEKPNHGIAFSIPVSTFLRSASLKYTADLQRGVEGNMYKAIFVVVDQGKAEEVVDSAKEAGARGATIIKARGSGIHETAMVFSMPIEPEKEIALILAKSSIAEDIVSNVREALNIDEPGKGIIFVLDVADTRGLVSSE